MNATEKRNPKQPRPFPWPCSRCMTPTVVPSVAPYSIAVKHDGTLYDLSLPEFKAPRCSTCGQMVVDHDADEQINNALRAQLHLLSPVDISEGLGKLGLKQQEFAEQLGVAPETVSRWLNGYMIQSRAMDNFMRVFFGVPQARELLCSPREGGGAAFAQQLGGQRIRVATPELQDAPEPAPIPPSLSVAPEFAEISLPPRRVVKGTPRDKRNA